MSERIPSAVRGDRLCLVVVMWMPLFFSEPGIIVWLFRILRKYDPKLKPLDIKFGSSDDYLENYSRAEDLDREISGLKEKAEAPYTVKRALHQREAGKLIPFFHLEMIFLTMLVLEGTPWLK